MVLPAQVAYTVEPFAELSTLGLYSLRAAGAEGTLAGEFFRALGADPGLATPQEASDFPTLLQHLADEEEADLRTYRQRNHLYYGILRDEGQGAVALPPLNEYSRAAPTLADLDFHIDGGLRLYGYPVAARVLLLFGGGYKTIRDPTACPNVAAAFAFAHQAVAALRHPAIKRQWQCRGTTFQHTGAAGPRLWLPPAPLPRFR